MASRDEHVAGLRVVVARRRRDARYAHPGALPRKAVCHCSMSTREGTSTRTKRPRRNASDTAAIATSVLPEPVTASMIPRRPQRNHETSASSCHRYNLRSGELRLVTIVQCLAVQRGPA